MAFKLNGKPITAIAGGSISDSVRRVALKLPDDDLLDLDEMAQRVGHNRIALASNATKLKCTEVMALVRVGTRQRRVFGNPKTIKKLVTALERA